MTRATLTVVFVTVMWLLSTISAAALVPERHQPRPIAYTRAADDLQRDFPTVDTSPGQAAHWLKTVQLNTLSTQPRARSGPTTQGGDAHPLQPQLRVAAPAGVEQWRSLVALYPWPVDTMLAIMRCESGGDPNARNRSGASGLFQLLPGPAGWADPATNIRLAYETKYVPSGLTPWNASSGCW